MRGISLQDKLKSKQMEENIVQMQPSKKSGKFINFLKAFLLALLLALIFLAVCMPFLITTGNLSYAEKASIGQTNLWRIVIGFGLLSIIATAYSFIRRLKNKFALLILWIFWILGLFLVLFISDKSGGIKLSSDVLTNDSPMMGIMGILPNLPFFIWIFGILYCRKTAMRLGKNGSLAILAGIFLPVISLIYYAFYSYTKKERKDKIKILKITASAIVAILLISAGAYYYILGTPEYSLYKLKRSITQNDEVEFEKYFDLESVAENFGESSEQSQEWIDSLNTSVLEIKEENPDKSKDANAYISTGLSGKYLKSASVEYSNQGSSSSDVALQFDKDGSKLFAEITKRNIGKRLAIYLGGQLISSPTVQLEIDNGAAIISGQDANQIKFIINTINEEKISVVAGFKIRKKTVDGNSAKITIGKTGNDSGFELSMARMEGRYWKVNKIDVAFVASGEKLPAPEGEKATTFSWKYKGKSYSLDEKLYDSYFKFYNSLPAQDVFNGESLVGSLEKNNELFISEFEEDKTIGELAQSIKLLGEKNNLNENQLVELVSTFVQTIPYDTEKFNNRKAGLDRSAEKPTYPYEVLYDNKGVCQDKSYLAYVLLKEMGYGVSLFLFPDPAENHMAVGVKCPTEYSNYDSGYCFLETTSLGNKIGSSPNLSKEFGTATSKVELSDFSNDSTESDYSLLGRIEVLNKIDGLAYTGVIDTFNTQKEIDNLFYAIRKMDGELNASRKDLDNQNEKIGNIVDKLDRLAKSSKNGSMSAYDDYNDLYPDYKKAVSNYEKDRKAFNAKVATRNQLNARYNSTIKSFYQ